MTNFALEPRLPPADERVVRAHADALQTLAQEHDITNLRFASPGRLVGHVGGDQDLFDVIQFDLAATRILGFEVHLFSDRVLSNRNVSTDLVEAQPL